MISASAQPVADSRKGEVETILSEMIGAFAAEGTFAEVGNFMAGKDEHFGLRDWARVFATVPSLRKYLVPALLWNLIVPRRERRGFSERFLPGRKYNFRYRSFCTDFLVWESVGRAARHFGAALPAGLGDRVAAYFDLAFANCYPVAFAGTSLPMFSYYPRKDHLVAPGTSVHKLFFAHDDNVPDLDTNCIIRGSMIALLDLFDLPASAYRDAPWSDVLSIYERHVHGAGGYGSKRLSYENGILPGDAGVYTWVFDDHNELDPTSNVNMLNYWIQLKKIHPRLDEDRVGSLTRGIFRFLLNHVRDGSFLDERFQSYYPLGPVYFFWQRFARNFKALGEAERALFDSDGAFPLIEDFLLARGRELFREGPNRNPYDLLTAAPFLYERGARIPLVDEWLQGRGEGLNHFRTNHYEIFHLRYPSKIICAPVRIPFACWLDLLTIVDKHPS